MSLHSTSASDHNEIHLLLEEIKRLDHRLHAVESSLIFRTCKVIGKAINSTRRRLGRWLLQTPLHPMYLAFRPASEPSQRYRNWLLAHQEAQSHCPQSEKALPFPVLSFLLPIHAPSIEWLNTAIESVQNQTSINWQLCLAIDGEIPREAEALLAHYVAHDPRITCVAGSNLGISGALNLALSCATGTYVALLDQDDVLEPYAVASVTTVLREKQVDLLYTDEGYIDEQGIPIQPNFKPDFSLELLLSCMYMGHLLVLRRQKLEESGRFRPEMDGAQDHDVALRFATLNARFYHLPSVLYHWRIHKRSTASSPHAKPYAHNASGRAIAEYIQRSGKTGTVEEGFRANVHQIKWHYPPETRLSLIIVTRTVTLLEPLLRSIRSSRATVDVEIVVVHHVTGTLQDRTLEHLAKAFQCIRTEYSGPFNFSRMCNQGALEASGPLLLFLNDDIRPQTPCWLERVAGHLHRPHVGIVGALLRYPDGTIQHAGISLMKANITSHIGRNLFESDAFPWITYSRDVSAVTGAFLAIRREVFERVGGFDSSYPHNFNDVDLCFRVRDRGFSVILDRTIELIHMEHATRPKRQSAEERLRFLRSWNDRFQSSEPYLSPHIDVGTEQPTIAITQ